MAARKSTATLLLVLVCIVVQLSAAAQALDPAVLGSLIGGGIGSTPNNKPRKVAAGGSNN